MGRLTNKELNKMSDADFIKLILNERKDSLKNPYSPLSERIKKAIASLDEPAKLVVSLPDGSKFIAEKGGDIPYPGICVHHDGSQGFHTVAFMEYDTTKTGKKPPVWIGAYEENKDEISYHEKYYDSEFSFIGDDDNSEA
jgi:hypothetical protein